MFRLFDRKLDLQLQELENKAHELNKLTTQHLATYQKAYKLTYHQEAPAIIPLSVIKDPAFLDSLSQIHAESNPKKSFTP